MQKFNYKLDLYFGSPGCGKTTFAVRELLRSSFPHNFCNFDVTIKCPEVTFCPSMGELGSTFVFPPDSLVIMDEASIDFNNRNWKAMKQPFIAWAKLHRHYKNSVILFSQDWDDVDVTLRRLVDNLWLVTKFGPFSVAKKVRKKVLFDDETHQIIDGYYLYPFFFPNSRKIIYRPFFYRYFDTYDVSRISNLPYFGSSGSE